MKNIIFVSVLLLLTFPAYAEEQNVSPGINQHYEGAQYQQWFSTFERPGREVYDRREEIVQALQLKAGMDVADIGDVTGFYSLLFAQKVGNSGRLYDVDIKDDFVRNIKSRAAESKLENIHAIISEYKDTCLDENSIDLAFVCNTYHHFEYPQAMLTSMRRALRNGGTLVIIDYRKQPATSSPWVMSHVRPDKQTVINEIEQAGFKLQSEPMMLAENYFLSFIKTDE